MNTAYLEEALAAKFVGQYQSGHRGAQILRFNRTVDGLPIVLKLAPLTDSGALEDINDNIFGYQEIVKLGGRSIIPSEIKEISFSDGRALLMSDLGQSMKLDNYGLEGARLLWRKFIAVIIKTLKRSDIQIGEPSESITEVVKHLNRFSQSGTEELISLLEKSQLSADGQKVALMPLDFTPDNLFINQGSIYFIDPWRQGTYLGNPAVSIGQFITLTKLYKMLEADKITAFLRKRCFEELPVILGCGRQEIKTALRLGATLQLSLSSYVRQENSESAAKLFDEAKSLWSY